MVKILTPLCGVGFTKTKISKIFNKNRKISFRITFFWLILSFLFLLFSLNIVWPQILRPVLSLK